MLFSGAFYASSHTRIHAYTIYLERRGTMKNSEKENTRKELLNLLGELPDLNRSISHELIGVEEREKYRLESLVLDLNGIEPVPAYFLSPLNGPSPRPAILYTHSHGHEYHIGKNELLHGRSYMYSPSYAEALTERGYSVLCIDHWGFGERMGRTETEIFKEMLWNGRVMWGMMVYDSLRSLDYLSGRTDVDNERIGALGMSMGSTMSWWIAALDTRLKVCVDLCCLTDFLALIESRGLDGHGIYYYVPGLLRYFTSARINSLIAPRPHLSLNGVYDPLTPVAGLDRIERELHDVYHEEGAPDAWQLLRYPTAHFETAAMRNKVLSFLDKWL